MNFEVPDLPYAFDALEPHIDARTMEIHHTKHHQAYINNVNGALESHAELAAKSVEDLVGDWDRPYTREQGCFPAGAFRVDKYWPPVNRVDNVYGDRNLVCSCPPPEAWATDPEDL